MWEAFSRLYHEGVNMAEAKKVSHKTKSGDESTKAKATVEAKAKTDQAAKKAGTTKKTEPIKSVSKTKATTHKSSQNGKTLAKKEVVKKAEELVVKEEIAKVKEIAETEAIAEEIERVEKEINAEEEKATAKAGKRSSKSLKEAEEKAAKESRKEAAKSVESQAKTESKKPVKVRSKLERRGKNYRKVSELVDKTKEYSIKEASLLIGKLNPVKFDASVEIHVRLGVDPKQADQNIRANLVLPAGTGKSVSVAVFADVDKLDAAKTAGADIAMSEDFLAQLDKEKIDFDILIATPSMMPKLGKYARLLGPKGLMPNPKSGTVTNDVAKAVEEAKAGKVEYRVDQNGIVHVAIGKISFDSDKIATNLTAVLNSVKSAKPSSIKGAYIKSVYLTTSMGPSVKIAHSEI
jgi:large subunit ribosomal protein L1